MSFISKDHFHMALKGVRSFLNQKADKGDLDKLHEDILDEVTKSRVQADWNETNKDSNAYIKNKPFEERELEYTFVDLEKAPASGQGAATLSSTCEYELIPGNMYRVIIDGVEKEVKCIVLDDRPKYRYLMLDDTSAWNNKTIYQYTDRINEILSFTPWSYSGTTSVKVIGKTLGVTKLDEKFIPDTFVKESDIASTDKYGITKLSDVINSYDRTTAASTYAVTRVYASALLKSGGTMTGDLTLKQDPTSNLHAATKQYVDNKALLKSGGTMTGNLTLKGDPTSNLHAATKQYVDNAIQQSDWSQNDETAIDFIKNKPFGVENRTLVVPANGDDYGRITDLEFAKLLWEKKEVAKYTLHAYNSIAGDYTYEQFEQNSDVEITIVFNNRRILVSVNIETGLIIASINGLGFIDFTISIPEVINTINDKFIPDTIARKTDIPDAVPTPATAKAGQIIMVKAVDENGKPIEWEAVDRHVKLSELENDLLYDNSQVVGAFTKDDWAEDADGNCTYKFAPKIEGLTPENFEIRLSYSIEGEEFQDIVNAAAIDSEVLTFEPENYFVVFHPMLTLMHGCQFDFETEEAMEAEETTVVLIGAAGAPFDYFTVEVYLVDKKVLPMELMDPELIEGVRQASLTAEDALQVADEALGAATTHKEAIYPAVQNTAGRFRVTADGLTVQKGTIITVVPDSDPQQTSVYLSVNGSTYYSVRRRYIGTVDKYNNDGHSSIYPRIFPGGHPVTLQFTGSEWVTITSFAVSDEDLQKAMPAYFHCSTAATTAEKSLTGSAYVTTGRLILVYFSDGNSAAAPKINLGGTYPIVDNTGNPIQDFNFPAGSCYLFVKTNQGWMKV